MVSIHEQIAHIFRRTTFGPAPGAVAEWVDAGPQALIDQLLSEDGFALDSGDVDDELPGEDYDSLPRWWIARLLSDDARLHERMTWFWHNHFTSSIARAPNRLMWRQHHLIRRHALGNFRELAQAMTIDSAMLYWLDGSGSRGESPNENLGRELMELMTVGAGNYTESDVRVAARALSGWWVDYETGDVAFDPEAHYSGPLTFLGQRARWTAEKLVDHLCDQAACAEFVAGRLYRYFVGTEPSDDTRADLGDVFRHGDLEVKPLVQEILRRDEFLDSIHARPRQPVEWVAAAMRALRYQPAEGEEQWWLTLLNQTPFYPPNVAGWPHDDRWVAASQVLTKGNIVAGLTLPTELEDSLEPTVENVLAHCGLYDITDHTRATLDDVASTVDEYDGRLRLMLMLVLNSPEFNLL